MTPAQLHREIWRLVTDSGGQAIDVDQTAVRLEVSPATVLDELRWLRNEGLIKSYRIAERSPERPREEDRFRVFVSHSSRDAGVAEKLVALLLSALRLPRSAILCSSLSDHGLPPGVDIHERLRREVHDTEAFVAIISPAIRESMYAMFELGARWETRKELLPVLAPNVSPSILDGPLRGLNAVRLDDAGHLGKLVRQIGQTLRIEPEHPDVYADAVVRLCAMRSSLANGDASVME